MRDTDAPYRIFGAELSPYSVKVRSWFLYKGLPYEWLERSSENQAEFEAHARLPLIPLVITPGGESLQDSTPLIETLEARHPEPTITPEDEALAFLSALIEEYADEWVNKPMFHYRWTYEADQNWAAQRIASMQQPDLAADAQKELVESVKTRMAGRLSFVGSHAGTRAIIEDSFRRLCALLEAHLEEHPYLFGGRPALADFGLYAQLYELMSDPTPGAHMHDNTVQVRDWIARMLEPLSDFIKGGFEPWTALAPTLEPLLSEEVAGLFLPWSDANARALEAGETEFTATLDGEDFTQGVQKYSAKSLGEIRRKYAAVTDKSTLDPVLERTGCLGWLQS